MRILQQYGSGPEPCHYLPDRDATQEYVQVGQLSPEEYEALMDQGWRKFGPVLFHPVCESCQACRPIRILVAQFAASRSQRRALAKNTDLEVRYGRPIVDTVRLALYNRYHTSREVRKGWPEGERSAEDYAFSFVHSPIPAVEISVWEAETLRAIVLTDITPNTVSGVYHYYEPEGESRSLGTFAMLQTITLAQKLGKPWAYFGYWVAACPSLSYKANFQPCEILVESGSWQAHKEPPK